MSSAFPSQSPRRLPENESRLATVFGWITVFSTGLLLASGVFDAIWRGLPSRWGQAAAFAIFVLAHVGSIGRKRPPIARALASLLFLAFLLEIYWFSWGPQDGTTFAWSNLTLESVRDGLLLWGLGLGALVLTLAPPRAHTRLLGAALGLFLMIPWVWGLSRGSSRITIIEGPEWLDWGWYIQPAFLGLSLLLPVALIALVETAYKISGMGALEHGVVVGLGFLSFAPIGLLGIHWFAPTLVQPAPKQMSSELIGSDTEDPTAAGAHGNEQLVLPGTDPVLQSDGHHRVAPSPGKHSVGIDSEQWFSPPWGLNSNDDLALCSSLLHPDAPLADLKSGFLADEWQTVTTLVLRRRYPDAAWLIEALREPEALLTKFPRPPVSWRRVALGLSSAIYQATRQLGFEHVTETTYAYPVGSERLLEVPRLSLFPRSELWASLPKPIRDLRITAATFEGEAGTRDIEGLLDRLNAYTWSLFTEVALLDQTAGRDIAARDAVIANLAYINAYLAFARNTHPEDYQVLVNSHDNRAGVVLLWDRAVCALRLSGTEARLGIDDIGLFPLVFSVNTSPEVDRLRAPPPTEHPPTEHPPTELPPTEGPPTEGPPTEHPPTEGPTTEGPATEHAPTEHVPTHH